MTAGRWLIGLVPALAATAAVAAQPAAQPSAPAAPEAAQKIAACEGQKFEFKAGEPRPTKITLCSDKGATTADLVRMFESAATKIEQLDKLPKDRRDELVAQLKAKIIEVQSGSAFVSPLPANSLPAPRPMPETMPPPEYALLPPLPSPVRRPIVAPQTSPPPEYAQLPPLPPPVRAPVVALSSRAPAVVLAKPRLTLECTTPGEIGEGGPCLNFAKDTLLTVRAGETLPAGTSLRFLRRGDIRAELALAQMRKGQSRRIKLPPELCAGVTGSNIEIQVVRTPAGAPSAGQVVDRRGPYQLRC